MRHHDEKAHYITVALSCEFVAHAPLRDSRLCSFAEPQRMASETATPTAVETDTTTGNWRAGVAGGLVGGVVFGALMSMMMTDVIVGAIPGMYGLGESGVAGWVIHMSHAAILGVVFAAIVGIVGVDGETAMKQVGVGLVYGVVLWAVLAVFVMPIWVGTMLPVEPPVPNINVQSLMGHAVYGVLLGAVYYALEGV